jgi:hypothetical protein
LNFIGFYSMVPHHTRTTPQPIRNRTDCDKD